MIACPTFCSSFITLVSIPTPLQRSHPDRAIQSVWQTPSPTCSLIVLVLLGRVQRVEAGDGQRCMLCIQMIIAKPRSHDLNITSPLNLIVRLSVQTFVHTSSTSRPPCELATPISCIKCVCHTRLRSIRRLLFRATLYMNFYFHSGTKSRWRSSEIIWLPSLLAVNVRMTLRIIARPFVW